jgi:hypothetical protein
MIFLGRRLNCTITDKDPDGGITASNLPDLYKPNTPGFLILCGWLWGFDEF